MDERPQLRFLTIAEVAYMTRLSKATVYRLVRAGTIPAMRFGRSYRVPETAVDDFIARAALDEGRGPDSRFL
jgi:excisionase family DNA binding protein